MTSRFEKLIQEASFPPLVARYFSQRVSPDLMSSSRIAKFQEEAIKEVISRAYENSPFYQRKMTEANVKPANIQSLVDLEKMPFTTKEDLRQDPWARLACDKKEISLIHVSSGTTGGKEIYTPHTWKEYYLNHSIIYPRLTPVKRNDLCFVALPYEMSQSGLNFHNMFLMGHQATSVAVGKGGAYSTPEKTIRLMRRLKPTFIATSPSYAMNLAEAAAEASFDPTSLSLKKMWVVGEGCSGAFRKRLEKIWGTTVNSNYGATECGFIGRECDAHNGQHITQAHVLVEIVDPQTGKVLKPGEIGEIVVTSMLRFDTPLIRYRTDDLGYLDYKPCRCGVRLPRLHLKGRATDHIVLQGKGYSPYALEEFLMRLPEVGNWYQFVIKHGDNEKLTIRTEPATGVEGTPELAQKLSNKLEVSIGVPCDLQFVGKLPRPGIKAIRVVYE
ncbi:AMP-binding protein [Desulfosporosinus sp. Sb-LF]|uniref:phenylacetate--CoA ligase family protein n=1 Tax=Desulfosporosinus sp. Sb-LF TaxID=2560027 RepID=UPI00107F4154|nr:AMP-binding protein [Desulfosporosinus sp. Sb-LF]TGE32126.1 phenylacetate--CoA ligase family protein [Desulfosporosinus sp. Sb-LF]